jgi:hypothetical protein
VPSHIVAATLQISKTSRFRLSFFTPLTELNALHSPIPPGKGGVGKCSDTVAGICDPPNFKVMRDNDMRTGNLLSSTAVLEWCAVGHVYELLTFMSEKKAIMLHDVCTIPEVNHVAIPVIGLFRSVALRGLRRR